MVLCLNIIINYTVLTRQNIFEKLIFHDKISH